MTIGIGFKCKDGIVLAADQQITWGTSHKAYEKKLRSHFGENWNATFTFADDPILWKSFNDKFDEAMRMIADPPVVSRIRDVIETVLSLFDSLRDDPTNLSLLCAVVVPSEEHALFRTSGYLIHKVVDYEYVGSGDSSLLRFLGPLITAPPPIATPHQMGRIVRQAVMMATYLILKAKTHVDGCGGDTDIFVVRPNGNLRLYSPSEIDRIEQMMLRIEHDVRHVSAHFFDKRFSDDQLDKTLQFLNKKLLSDHQEFQIPVD